MTTHTETREAVAREIVLGAGVEPMAVARTILARLAELGWVQRDMLLSEEAVEAAADALSENMVKGVVYLDGRAMVRLAIVAAIAKAGN